MFVFRILKNFEGYAVLHGAIYTRLQKATHGYMGGCIKLRTVTLDYTGTTDGYTRLQRSTCSYLRLHRKLHEATKAALLVTHQVVHPM